MSQAGSVSFRRGASEGFEEKKYRIPLTVPHRQVWGPVRGHLTSI